jgi:hypothetical protein
METLVPLHSRSNAAKVVRMTTLICSIPEKLDVRLDQLARQARVPKGKFVRRALEEAVRKPKANGAAFKLVSKLCGSLSRNDAIESRASA